MLTFGSNNLPIKRLHYCTSVTETFVVKKNCSVFCIWMWQELFSTTLPQRCFKCSVCILCSSVADCLKWVHTASYYLIPPKCCCVLGKGWSTTPVFSVGKGFHMCTGVLKIMFLLNGKLRDSFVLHLFQPTYSATQSEIGF